MPRTQKRGRLILMPDAQDMYAGQIKGLKDWNRAQGNLAGVMLAERASQIAVLTNERDQARDRVDELTAEIADLKARLGAAAVPGTGEQPAVAPAADQAAAAAS